MVSIHGLDRHHFDSQKLQKLFLVFSLEEDKVVRLSGLVCVVRAVDDLFPTKILQRYTAVSAADEDDG